MGFNCSCLYIEIRSRRILSIINLISFETKSSGFFFEVSISLKIGLQSLTVQKKLIPCQYFIIILSNSSKSFIVVIC